MERKKLSKATIDAISRISPDELEAHGVIVKANVSGYCCPMCGNGTGDSGTGINPLVDDVHVGWHCFKCGETFDNLEILARHFELDRKKDFMPLVEKICAQFNIKMEFVDFDAPKIERHKLGKKKRKEEKVDEMTLRFIEADLKQPTTTLEKLLSAVKLWRGLPLETLLKFNCRVDWQWTPPGSRCKPYTPTGRVLIPCSNKSYLARLIDKVENLPITIRDFFRDKQKMHAGKKSLFNADVLKYADTIFCVEGYIDAMSIDYAGYPCVALGGADRADLIVDVVDKMERKPRIIILLDNDDTGRNAAKRLYKELIGICCPACVRYLSDDDSKADTKIYEDDLECISGAATFSKPDKVDANSILEKEGVDALRSRLDLIFNDALAEFEVIKGVIAERKANRINDETLTALFDGNASDMVFARRLEIYRGDKIRWLTDDERWLIYKDGVWKKGSEKNSCVMHFGRELSDALIENAQNQDERELAEKFQSATKIGTAFTLLKGFDLIRIEAADLDNHPELLNCKNGVVNLQTGELMDAAPELLITQMCNANYDPAAQSELVTKFFIDIQPDEQTCAGFLRWLGYCITAETNAEKFLIWYGTGANGKGITGKTMLELLGDYGTGLTPRALLRKRSGFDTDPDKATTSLNRLIKKRFALSEELPMDAEIDASLTKTLSGGDKINLRKNYGEYDVLDNYSKLNISGNYLPKLENISDEGILRRLLVMPFKQKFGTPERPADPNLKRKMLEPENLDALLAILVREAQLYYRDGLIISDQMLAETAKHIDQNDFVSEFFEENYVRDENSSVKVKSFLDALKGKYPHETFRFKRDDLIALIEKVIGVTCTKDKQTHAKIFKGIKHNGNFDGEPVFDTPPFC